LSKPVELSNLKIGQYIIIDDEPCKLVEYDKSKPGKHGAAKARVVGIGVFTGQKRSLVSPVDTKVNVPIIEKKTAQIISIMDNIVQAMDMSNYITFETSMPSEEDIKSLLAPGVEVEYWEMIGKKKIVRIK